MTPIFSKNVPENKFSMGKIFKLDIIVLKHVLDHSKSISTKTIFENFSIFLVIFGAKNRFFALLGGEILNFFSTFQKYFIAIILRYCTHP